MVSLCFGPLTGTCPVAYFPLWLHFFARAPTRPRSRKLSVPDGGVFSRDELIALRTLFGVIDRNGDGELGVSEFVAWAEDTGEWVDAREVELVVEAVQDGDDEQEEEAANDDGSEKTIGFEGYLLIAMQFKSYYRLEKMREQKDEEEEEGKE